MKPLLKRGGFTLIEVLVAVTLLALISILVWQAMGSTVKSKERFETKDQVFRSVSLAMARVSHDLKTAFLFSRPEILGLSVNGEQMSKNVFIGVNQGELDKVTFVTFNHLRYVKDSKESDQAEVGYFVENGTVETEEGEALVPILKKREASPPDTQPEEGGRVINVLEGVKEFDLRYYREDRDEFVEGWDSTGIDNLNKLPLAVEMTMAVADPFDEEASIKFKTIVFLEMAPGPNDF